MSELEEKVKTIISNKSGRIHPIVTGLRGNTYEILIENESYFLKEFPLQTNPRIIYCAAKAQNYFSSFIKQVPSLSCTLRHTSPY
jgi:Mg2+/citrate symporter